MPLSLTPAAATRVGTPLPKHSGATAIGYGPSREGGGGRRRGEVMKLSFGQAPIKILSI